MIDGGKPRYRPHRGRGAASNPAGRFERIASVPEEDDAAEEHGRPRTLLLKDHSKSIISRNDSPDIGYEFSVNPYRGCEHGCIYCYARPYHEYLGFSAGLDFETRILVKEDAAVLLRRELSSARWEPKHVVLSGVTDPYQPIERRLFLTRHCLEVLTEFRNPVLVVTKNQMVTRDLDLIGELAAHDAAAVFISVTTLDGELARVLEPRTSAPERRLAAIDTLVSAGVPTGVLVAPVIPGLNDHEIPSILEEASKAGARRADYTLLRLPHGVADLFEQWLRHHRPQHAEKVLNRIRSIRGGKLNDSRFGVRFRGTGPYAEQIAAMFRIAQRRTGLAGRDVELSVSAFRKPESKIPAPRRRPSHQRSLFDPPD